MSVAAAITAIGALGATAYNNFMQKQRYNQQLQDERSNWYMNNAYNSPTAQMHRLKAAGLNPNLIYQNGAAVQPSSMPSTPDYQYEPINGSDIVGSAYQADATQAAIDQASALTQKTNAEAANLINDNRIKDTPLGRLAEYSLFTREEKEALAQTFNMTVPQMEQQTFRFVAHKADYEKAAKDSQQLSKLLNILENTEDQSLSEALSAKFQMYVDFMQAHSEAKLRGFEINKVSIGDDNYFVKGIYKNPNALDYIASEVIQDYNNVAWEYNGFGKALKRIKSGTSIIGDIFSPLKLRIGRAQPNELNQSHRRRNY